MSTAAAQAPPQPSSEHVQRLLAGVAVVPVLASVYQTLVLTDVTSDVIRKGIEGDSYQMIWTNVAWGAGLLSGPAIAGFVFERAGFTRLTLLWAPLLLIVSLLLAGVQSGGRPVSEKTGAGSAPV